MNMDSKTAALLIALAVLAAAGNSVADQPAFLVGGIQVHEHDHDHWTETLLDVGMNTVAVTVYAKQGAWDSSHLWFEDEEPSVLDEIRTAKAKGLAVVLVLRVAVDHAFPENQFIWHGMIMPSSAEEIRAWFANYERFVLKWARVSQREGVDLLGLGSEMKALSATLPIGRRGNLKNYYGYYWYQRLSRKRAQRFADQIEQRHLWTRGPCLSVKKMATKTTATKTASHLYSAVRKALAPSWIIFEMSCIFSLPASCFMIPPYLKKAKARARTEAPAAT